MRIQGGLIIHGKQLAIDWLWDGVMCVHVSQVYTYLWSVSMVMSGGSIGLDVVKWVECCVYVTVLLEY